MLTAPGRQELILDILAEHYPRELYGREIVALSEGRLEDGVIYADLRYLEDEGFIVSRQELSSEVGDLPYDPIYYRPRRLYRLRDYGVRRHPKRKPSRLFQESWQHFMRA